MSLQSLRLALKYANIRKKKWERQLKEKIGEILTMTENERWLHGIHYTRLPAAVYVSNFP